MSRSNLELPFGKSLNAIAGVVNGGVSEVQIEQYVRFPETLDSLTLEAVGKSLKKLKKEMAIERFYRQYYQEYDKLNGATSAKVSAFVSSLFE